MKNKYNYNSKKLKYIKINKEVKQWIQVFHSRNSMTANAYTKLMMGLIMM
jgi:hypothetical protein